MKVSTLLLSLRINQSLSEKHLAKTGKKVYSRDIPLSHWKGDRSHETP
jgi:hypothetical protein